VLSGAPAAGGTLHWPAGGARTHQAIKSEMTFQCAEPVERPCRLVRRARHASGLFLGIALWSLAVSALAIQPFRYQGFNMMAFNKSDYADATLVAASLDYVVSRGSNLVVIDWNVAFDDDGSLLPQTSPRVSEPPRADIVRLVERARERGLKVFLKPHIGFPDTPFGNRGTWNTDMSRFSMDTFFEQWTTYLVGLSGMATSLGVDAIVIGTENIGSTARIAGSGSH